MIAKNQRANGDGSGSAKGGKVTLPWLAPLEDRPPRVSHSGFAHRFRELEF